MFQLGGETNGEPARHAEEEREVEPLDYNFCFEGGHVKVMKEKDSLVDRKLRGLMGSHLKIVKLRQVG